MASVAKLTRPHWLAQGDHMTRAQYIHQELFDFSAPADLDPEEYQRQSHQVPLVQVRPLEHRVLHQWEHLSKDPTGTQSAWHDVVPREVLLERDPLTTDRSGSDVICREVGALLFEKLNEHGLIDRARDAPHLLHEHFTVRDCMPIHVVNLVHTSYLVNGREAIVEDAPTSNKSKKKKKTTRGPTTKLVSSFIWRKLAFLGCQENSVHTSQKISFKPPFKVTEILFPPGRVLQTGAFNEDIAHILFYHGTLEYLKRTGLHELRVIRRESQNVVAKSWMPNHQGLLLELMQHRLQGQVEYSPEEFAGALVKYLPNPKIKLLAFKVGSVVFVGPADVPAMHAAVEGMYDLLANNVDTPENRVILERFQASGAQVAAPAVSKKRKRPAATGQKAQKRPRLENVSKKRKRAEEKADESQKRPRLAGH